MTVGTTSSNEVLAIMLRLMKMENRKIESNEIIIRHVRATFGIDVETTAYLRNLMVSTNDDLPNNFKVKHLLWFLSYCKTYLQYENYTSQYNCAKTTFRSWVLFVGRKIMDLDVVSKILICYIQYTYTYIICVD
jgi:hypothetical protein